MIYADARQTSVLIGGILIPRTHRLWRRKGIDKAEVAGTIRPWVDPTPRPEDPDVAKARAERGWRDEELAKADTELYIIQDGRGSRTVGELRDWRNLLRDYPQHELFPWGPRPPYLEDEIVVEE